MSVTVTDRNKGELTVEGRLLAAVTSKGEGPKALNYSTLAVYRTEEARWLLKMERIRNGLAVEGWEVFRDRRELQDWLGFGSLPIRLYQAAGWPI